MLSFSTHIGVVSHDFLLVFCKIVAINERVEAFLRKKLYGIISLNATLTDMIINIQIPTYISNQFKNIHKNGTLS